ncbi:hypothetical protein [Methylobacterium sp. 391_Methyba4]|uniref:hypothetical protein n=1 Tax=Methylobacterium sp. 391_Methyba4 TaxID=3038924 RepID=UPI00241C0540|nr:hypothetical protein [Methylobacterium sp. 391_Methyba4]WFS10467.1 hypothetical protein P9K36_14805 [Methylobacterium sp. 391_Methyba4]
MRTILTLAGLAVAGTATAAPMDEARWHAGTTERRGHDELTTSLSFERIGAGEWAVSARCETRDTRTGRWRARTGTGAAARSMGLILIDVPKVGRMVLNERSGEVFGTAPGCAQGTVDIGTGD